MLTLPPPAALRLASSAALLPLLLTSGDLKLKENEHKSLSKLVDAYYTARDEEKGISDAMQDVLDQIESTDKRLKGQKLLSSVGDWEQVFRLVTEGRLKTTLKKKGEVTNDKRRGANGIEVSFAYCVPKKPAKGALPLILIACDSEEAPSAHLNTHWNDPALREAAVLMALDMGKDMQSWGVFGSPDAPGGAFTVMTALGVISREFPVDANRTFLVGSGKGFAAVEATAAAFPHIFAGIIGIGDVAALDAKNLENFRNLPTLFPRETEGSRAIKAKLDELGFGNCTITAKPADDDKKIDGTPAETWGWIGKTIRTAYPPQITFSPKNDYARRAHWLSLEGVQAKESPRVDAKADKATNTITITAEKVSDLVVYLNDELLDLDKPVKLVVNGATHERTVERSAPEMIQNQYFGGDWGRVFTASVTQDVK